MQHLFPEPKSKYAPKHECYSHYHYHYFFYHHGYCDIWKIFPSIAFLLVWYKIILYNISLVVYGVLIINTYILSSREL